jgi:long-subunit fatty acid transport protein
MSFEGTAFNLAGTIGAAYKFDKMFSGALGYRYTYAIREYKGSVSGLNVTSATAGTVLNSNGANYFLNQAFAAAGTDFSMKSTVDGMAHSVVAGANIKPNEDLNIGIKFEYSTALVLKYKTEYTGNANLKTAIETGTNFKDGNKVKDSEPMIAAIGVSYWILPKQLRVEVDVTYSFDSMNALGKDSAGEENNTRYHNFFFAGLALEYVIDKGILASVGYAYDSGSRKDRGRTEMDFGAPVHHVALGGKYAFNETVGMQLGFVYSMYQDTKNDTDSVVTASAPNTAAGLTKVTQNYKMTSYDIGIGVDMKF